MIKKTQVKMFEKIAILLIFFFLIFFFFFFFFFFLFLSLQSEKEKLAQLYAFQIATKTFSMPELDCSVGGLRLANCFDKIKIKEFRNMLNEDDARLFYFKEFGFATIKIQEIYPNNEEFILYNITPKSFKSKYTSFSPMILFNSLNGEGCMNLVKGTCSFGIIEVSYYVEQ